MGLFDFLKPIIFVNKQLTSVDERKISEEWDEIAILMKAGKPSNLKDAVIKADKLLDFALMKIVEGETMGERLKTAKDRFSFDAYDKAWKAHKVRNAMAHEIDYDPPHFITTEALNNFKEAFKDLGIRL